MDEFLRKLRSALSGEIPDHEIEQNINYYANYFLNQANSGKTEAEILEDLGDPTLIARSIIDADRISGKASYNFNNSASGEYTSNDNTNTNNYREKAYRENNNDSSNYRQQSTYDRTNNWKSKVNGWREREMYEYGCCGGGCLKIGLIIFFVLLLVVAIISTLFKGIFSIFKVALFGGGPVIIILLIILLVLLFRGRR